MIYIRLLCALALLHAANASLPDKVICADELCSVPISKAKATLNYQGADANRISMPANSEVTVYMKPVEANFGLWYVEVNGKRGFVPNRYLRENKVLSKNKHIVPFEQALQNVPVQISPVQPDKVHQAHEVVDGTTLYSEIPLKSEASVPAHTDAPLTITPPLIEEIKVAAELPSLVDVYPPKIQEDSKPSTNQHVNSAASNLPLTSEVDFSHTIQNIDGSASLGNELNRDSLSAVLASGTLQKQEDTPNPDLHEVPTAEKMTAEIAPNVLIEKDLDNTEIKFDENKASSLHSLPQVKIEKTMHVPTEGHMAESSQVQKSITIPIVSEGVISESVTSPPDLNSESILSQSQPSIEISKTEPVPYKADVATSNSEANSQNIYPEKDLSAPCHLNLESPPHGNEEKPIDEIEVYENDVKEENDSNEELEESSTQTESEETPNIYQQEFNSQLGNLLNSISPETIKPDLSEHQDSASLDHVTPSVDLITPSVDNVIPPVDHIPTSVDHITPSVDNVTPSVDNITHSVDHVTPSVDHVTPSVDHVTPSVDHISPVNHVTPPVYHVTPSVDHVTPSVDHNTPSVDHITPLVDHNTPSVDHSPPSVDHITPLVDHATPSVDHVIPSVDHVAESLIVDFETTTESFPSISKNLVDDLDVILRNKHEEETAAEEGLFSGLYKTFLSWWPTAPESPENYAFREKEKENEDNIYSSEEPKTHETVFETKIENPENTDTFSIVEYIISIYNSVIRPSEETKALFAATGETCLPSEYYELGKAKNSRLFVFLIITAASVLIFTLGYYYIDNKQQDGRLVAMINKLQRDLLCTTKECEILKDELTSTKGKLAGIEDSSFGMDDMVQSLKEEIEEWKRKNEKLRISLDDNEKLLRVSENTASELQNTLMELENTLGELLSERGSSEDQLAELNEKVQAFEEELMSVSRERDEYQLKLVSAEKSVEELKKLPKQMEDLTLRLKGANSTIELHQHEIVGLKDLLKGVQSGSVTAADVNSLIDQTEFKAQLTKALQEKTTFENKFESERSERARLQAELGGSRQALEEAQQRAGEAATRLDVLGKYFQEREAELLKELNTKEALWLSKQGESISTVEKIEALQQEVHQYKEMCESARRELAEQEAERRTAVAALEARAHAAWLEARAARRDAHADREEAAALRRKMASLATSPPPAADYAPPTSPHQRMPSPLDVGLDGVPPPLPPMAFLPPPLLPPLPRPPPLGRLPSPPPRYGEQRYSPDSRYSPESRYSPQSRYSPETVRYSPDSRSRRSPYPPRRRYSRERYYDDRSAPRPRNGHPATETETDYSPPLSPAPRRRSYSKRSGPSSGSGRSSESEK